ncbi:MAG TPA: NYN domain-containing protein [Thermoleophilaceae bacterium]
MRRLIVDGMNVIGSRPDGWWRDREGAMRVLAEQLELHAERTGDQVAVVFDGRPHEVPGERVDVTFASTRGPNAADRDIAERVERDPDPASLAVVTSDQALAERVRAAGAQVIGAGSFRRELEQS